ncbi:SDR family oxidoreductase [Paraburkholderia jirisanensis]
MALVTNASGYAGPPAVTALLAAGFRVLAHDERFADIATWQGFADAHIGAEPLVAHSGESLIEAAWLVSGRIDTIVSNDHHPAAHVPTPDAALVDLRQSLEVLVERPFALVRAAIKRLEEQGGGNIVMITSCRTRLPMSGGAIPDAARAAANALVRSFAIELAPLNISVNAIAPNFLYSEAYFPRAVFVDEPRGRAYVESAVPVQRLGHPSEIGELIAYLATTPSRFLTGSIIDFAGGWPAAQPRPVVTGVER